MLVIKPLRLIDPLAPPAFDARGSTAIVKTQDGKILLQQRDDNIDHFPGMLGTFGGGTEPGETPFETLRRELQEELGGDVRKEETVYFGTLEETFPEHTEVVDIYFWHDRRGTITGCYEGSPRYYDRPEEAIAHPKIMDDVVWSLLRCQERGLL